MLSIQCINITYRTTGGPATFTPLKHMKKLIIPSLTALSTVGAAFAQTPSPTPTPATPQDDITRLEAQLKVAKLEAELAAVKGTPTPATTPAPPTIIINNTVAPTVQQNTPPPVAAIIQTPVVVEQAPPVVVEQPAVTQPPPSYPSLMEWVVNVNDALIGKARLCDGWYPARHQCRTTRTGIASVVSPATQRTDPSALRKMAASSRYSGR